MQSLWNSLPEYLTVDTLDSFKRSLKCSLNNNNNNNNNNNILFMIVFVNAV